MTEQERQLRALMIRAQRYIRHDPGCAAGREWAWSEKCTCGAKDVYDRIQLEKLALREAGRRRASA